MNEVAVSLLAPDYAGRIPHRPVHRTLQVARATTGAREPRLQPTTGIVERPGGMEERCWGSGICLKRKCTYLHESYLAGMRRLVKASLEFLIYYGLE